jgi:hypothetical protein
MTNSDRLLLFIIDRHYRQLIVYNLRLKLAGWIMDTVVMRLIEKEK